MTLVGMPGACFYQHLCDGSDICWQHGSLGLQLAEQTPLLVGICLISKQQLADSILYCCLDGGSITNTLDLSLRFVLLRALVNILQPVCEWSHVVLTVLWVFSCPVEEFHFWIVVSRT